MAIVSEFGSIGQHIEDLDTPSLLLDLDAVERNLDAMAAALAGSGMRLRPHTKTHKAPVLAHMQIARGAIGVCCAKLGEAEVMAAGGVSGLLVTTEVVGAAKIRRLLGIAHQVEVITVVDDVRAAAQLSEAALSEGVRLRCLIDVNIGQNRTGVEPGTPALELARAVDGLKGLQVAGLQGYQGHLQHVPTPEMRAELNASSVQLLGQTAELLRADGFRMEIVSGGGTGTCQFAANAGTYTELQAGSYVVMDAQYAGVQGVQFEHALSILTSVVSVNRDRSPIVDVGTKSASTDAGPPTARGLDATYAPLGDEHGKLVFEQGNPLALGDKVELIPGHCDTTINLYDVYHVTRGGRVVAIWPIAGRGRTQ